MTSRIWFITNPYFLNSQPTKPKTCLCVIFLLLCLSPALPWLPLGPSLPRWRPPPPPSSSSHGRRRRHAQWAVRHAATRRPAGRRGESNEHQGGTCLHTYPRTFLRTYLSVSTLSASSWLTACEWASQKSITVWDRSPLCPANCSNWLICWDTSLFINQHEHNQHALDKRDPSPPDSPSWCQTANRVPSLKCLSFLHSRWRALAVCCSWWKR